MSKRRTERKKEKKLSMRMLTLFVLSLFSVVYRGEGRRISQQCGHSLHSRVGMDGHVHSRFCLNVSNQTTDQDAKSHQLLRDIQPRRTTQISTANSLNRLLREGLVQLLGYVVVW